MKYFTSSWCGGFASLIAVAACLALSAKASAAATGANIDESLATIVLHVDPVNGLDGPGRGSLSQPLRTLGEAVSRAQGNRNVSSNPGTRIVLADGVYREAVDVFGATRPNAPIVIEATNPGNAILSGSDVVTQWESVGGGVYRTPWNNTWGVRDPIWPTENGTPRVNELGRRGELIHVDGERYTPVSQLSHLDRTSIQQSGGFWVDEQPGGGHIYVRPKDGTNFGNATKEVSVRGRDSLLTVFTSDVVVRGLTIQHAAGVDRPAFRAWGSDNVLIEDVVIRDNNFGGLSFGDNANITVRDSAVIGNGFTGNGGSRIDNLLMESFEASENNWRGELGGMTGWASAGIKHLFTTNATYRDLVIRDNRTHGIWFDTENADILVERLVAEDNLRNGVYLEANDGDVTLADAIIRGNDRGVFIANQMNATITDSTITDNDEQISFDQRRNQQLGPSGDRGNRFLELFNNIIGTSDASQTLLINNNFNPEGERWDTFLETLVAAGNTYYHPNDELQFPTQARPQIDFDAWVASLEPGQEAGSRFLMSQVIPEPATASLAVLTSFVLLRRSPARSAGISQKGSS